MDRRASCHPDRPFVAKGLCRACYQQSWLKRDRTRPISTKSDSCKECGDKIDLTLAFQKKGFYVCKPCFKISRKTWYIANYDERREKANEWRKIQRQKALDHYGGQCVCCGESQFEFLSFDHINGGGNAQRRNLKIGSMGLWLVKNNYPDGFQILCHNCNLAKGFYGKCPHQQV